MSMESVASAGTKELENDQLRVEKKNLEDEISRIGKHLDEIRRESSIVSTSLRLQWSNLNSPVICECDPLLPCVLRSLF